MIQNVRKWIPVWTLLSSCIALDIWQNLHYKNHWNIQYIIPSWYLHGPWYASTSKTRSVPLLAGYRDIRRHTWCIHIWRQWRARILKTGGTRQQLEYVVDCRYLSKELEHFLDEAGGTNQEPESIFRIGWLFGLQTVNVNKWERVNVRSALVKELQVVCYDVITFIML